MSNYESIDVVRALAATEINKLTNIQLRKALATLLENNVLPQGPSNADLLNELNAIWGVPVP